MTRAQSLQQTPEKTAAGAEKEFTRLTQGVRKSDARHVVHAPVEKGRACRDELLLAARFDSPDGDRPGFHAHQFHTAGPIAAIKPSPGGGIGSFALSLASATSA